MEYLNLALNNIERIEGLRSMEFLNKLDLTVNFIDCDSFEDSISELRYNRSLKELYLMGNPATDWNGHRLFVIGVLAQLKELDGKEITRTERIKAVQQMPELVQQLRKLAVEARNKKIARQYEPYDEEEYSTRSRLEMYREIAEEKMEAECRKKQMEPKDRDYATEHSLTIEQQRKKERECGTHIRQCNEGRYAFRMEEEDGKGNVILEVDIPKFIDTSLVDVDVQPTYASIVVKNKTTRLLFPYEVQPDDGFAQRSQVSGTLKLVMPKTNSAKILKAHNLKNKIRLGKNEKERKYKDTTTRKARENSKVGYKMMQAATIVQKNVAAIVCTQDRHANKSGTQADFPGYIDDLGVPPIE